MLVRERGHELQHCQSHEVSVPRRSGTESERGVKRVALWRRQIRHTLAKWAAQLLQRGVRELHLRLDSGHARDHKSLRSPHHFVEKDRLSHPGLAPQDRHAAPPCARLFHQRG